MQVFDPAYYTTGSDSRTPEEIAFENLPAAAVRDLVQRATATDEENAAANVFHTETEPLFRKINPAYIDNQHNMKLLKNQWETTYGVVIPTYEQLEECYFTLRTAGVLNLNKAAVERESAQDIAVKADRLIAARKAATFDEADAYSMSMQDLEKRARGWS